MMSELTYCGLTQQEQAIMDDLVGAVNKFSQLPIQHPNEREEFVAAVHTIQGLLATRIARREYPLGWPTYGDG